MKRRPSFLATAPVVPVPKNDVAGLRRHHDQTVEQGFRLLRGMKLFAVFVLQAFVAAANRQIPVAAQLLVVVKSFHRFVVEGVFRPLTFRAPDHRFVRVAQARAFHVRHRVVFDPHNVV